METVNLQSVQGLGLKSGTALEARKYGNTSYTVDVGQALFQRSPTKKDETLPNQGFDKDLEYLNSLNVELTADHVPLGEILERLQSDEPSDRNNLIRLHSASDNTASTISATLNVATLDLSSSNNSFNQQQFRDLNDVLFNIKTDCSPSPTSTSSSLMSSPSFSPSFVPEITFLSNNNNNSVVNSAGDNLISPTLKHSPLQTGSGQATSFNSSLSPQGSSEGSKTSPQECNLCSKMFGNASALAKHRLTHSDERKYLCTVCHKAFKRQDHLNGHLLTHRNKKPFECSAQGCNKSYCDARSLRRHRENHHSNKEEKMLVSPSSSVSSSIDLDDKSFGSDTFDNLRNMKPKLLLDKDKTTVTVEAPQMNILERYIRSDQSGVGIRMTKPTPVTVQVNKDSEAPTSMVECTICERRFKNIPALNGHMRLHGGYYRKDNDKKPEPRIVEASSHHTVSTNVKNLIEEKIIQKRKLEPVQLQQHHQQKQPQLHQQQQLIQLQPQQQRQQHFQQRQQIQQHNSSNTTTEIRFPVSSIPCPITIQSRPLCSTPVVPISVPSPTYSTQLSLSLRSPSPPKKVLKPSEYNLVFPVLPQPDTSKLLDNLERKSSQFQGFLPNQPLPNVPLPNHRISAPVNTKPPDTSQKPAHINHHHLLKVTNKHKEPRIGIEYQAYVPAPQNRFTDEKYGILSKETLMWNPETNSNVSQKQVDSFLKFCSSTAVSISLTDEDALQVLNRNQGNVFKATQEILSFPWSKEEKAASGSSWTSDQVDMFYEALCRHKKNFRKISSDIPGKSEKDCVEFYYIWKNLCREESQSFKPIISSNVNEDYSSFFTLQ